MCFDVGVLLVLLFDGEWFLLFRVVVFISFPCAGLPGPCCDAAFASSTAVAFLLSPFSLCVACLCIACLTLSWCFALPSSPSLFRIVGQRLPSLLVSFGWLVSLPEFSFPLCALQFRDWVFAVSVSDGIPLAA